MRPLVPVLCCLLLAPMTGALSGQSSPSSGFWIGGTVGTGWSGLSCGPCDGERDIGVTGDLHLGGVVDERMFVGAEVSAWYNSESSVSTLVTSYQAVGFYTPDPTRPLFLKGGIGVTEYRVREKNDDDELTAKMPAVTVGAGLRFALGSRYSIMNSLELSAASFGTLKAGGSEVTDGVSLTRLRLGIGVIRR